MNEIKFQNLTPAIYYNQSRDFQFIGRLFEIIFNSVKTNTELIYSLPISSNSDKQLIDLMALTFGFKSKHNYNLVQLTAICNAFAEVIKNKGNLKSIIIAINALLNAEGITQAASYELSENNTVLTLFIPQMLSDFNLIRDLLSYILPAGMRCNITKEIAISSEATTKIGSQDTIIKYNESGVTNTNTTSIIPKVNAAGIADDRVKNTAGVLANSWIYIPGDTEGE